MTGEQVALLSGTALALWIWNIRARRVDRSAERLDLLLDTEKEGSQ